MFFWLTEYPGPIGGPHQTGEHGCCRCHHVAHRNGLRSRMLQPTCKFAMAKARWYGLETEVSMGAAGVTMWLTVTVFGLGCCSPHVINSVLVPTIGEKIMLAHIIDEEREYDRQGSPSDTWNY
ncbi:hypothetical protein Bca52824_038345 [Brassica carinata]|uniref:Uncharacterized protein n=1 Tax=Brassica carinata TaxID=52824 RepID=A0A8X7UVW5_BRACI|nr:hypothetical protein Bca52824_038345 [Brassica carinata]